MARDRLRELDLLRFAAAMAVLAFHFTGRSGAARDTFPGLGEVTRYGYLGVDLFFMISGFVILMSAWGRGPGEFGVSRLVRLMPAYWFSVLLVGASHLAFGLGDGEPGRLVPNLTMMQRGLGAKDVDGVYWTLWVELHFYALIAVLAAVGITYRRCVAFMAGWLILGAYAEEAGNELLRALLVPRWSPYFVAGMALYLLHRFGPSLLAWGFVAAGGLLAAHWSAWRAGHVKGFAGASPEVAVICVTAIVAVMALVATGRLRWLRWRGLTTLGALTYPLYLTHSAVARPLREWLAPGISRWAVLAAVTAAALVLAYAVYRLVERPAQAWLRPRLRESLALARLADAPARPAEDPARSAEPSPRSADASARPADAPARPAEAPARAPAPRVPSRDGS